MILQNRLGILGACLSGGEAYHRPDARQKSRKATTSAIASSRWQPVMVAGEPQWKHAEPWLREGIPAGPGLLSQIHQIAQACAALWLLN